MAEINITRILYMEDDPGLSRLLQKSLQRRGYIVDTAPDGEDGLRKLEASRYDLLLVDYNMPFLCGTDVIRALCSKNALLPTIMVTGQGNEEVAVEALKLGALDYVVKDVEMKYLDLLPVVIDRVMYQQHLIRERQQMENAVRESEERYRRLVELSPDGIAVHVDGRFVFVNPAGARYLGAQAPEDLLGRKVLDVIHPDFRDMAKSRMQVMEQGNGAPWVEEKFLRLDGSELDVEVAGVPFIHQGKPALQIIFRDITERKHVKERLESLALYDALTGLPNRVLLFERMTQLISLARRNKGTMAALYMDMDRFKQVNDTMGHEVGDMLLAEAGERMRDCIRKSDTIARMGGDEFVCIGIVTETADAAVLAGKLIKVLSDPFVLKGRECSIGASIGISLFPQDGETAEVLLKKADTAMYRVKEHRKGGHAFFSPPQ